MSTKLLVVEDEPLIRMGLVSVMEDAGFSALEAADADEAITILEGDTDIHLVITDVDMPGSMDGVKLAHFVRKRWPPVRIIVVSGKLAAASLNLPEGTRFFGKPYPEAQLIAAIHELIAADRA